MGCDMGADIDEGIFCHYQQIETPSVPVRWAHCGCARVSSGVRLATHKRARA